MGMLRMIRARRIPKQKMRENRADARTEWDCLEVLNCCSWFMLYISGMDGRYLGRMKFWCMALAFDETVRI
jgi:hypothetical protein